jgi:hypothetical protein
MHAPNAMHRFSREHDGLFSCTIGGETHIWIELEDVAQDLLCEQTSTNSTRADFGV